MYFLFFILQKEVFMDYCLIDSPARDGALNLKLLAHKVATIRDANFYYITENNKIIAFLRDKNISEVNLPFLLVEDSYLKEKKFVSDHDKIIKYLREQQFKVN
jgi:hypothetical protein